MSHNIAGRLYIFLDLESEPHKDRGNSYHDLNRLHLLITGQILSPSDTQPLKEYSKRYYGKS